MTCRQADLGTIVTDADDRLQRVMVFVDKADTVTRTRFPSGRARGSASFNTPFS
jgi:hypothetical protein